MAKNLLDVNDVVLTNQGKLLVDNVELAELKDLTISIEYNTKTLAIMNSVTEAELNVGATGTITFTLNKVSSRFKPKLLACAKAGKNFVFDLYAEAKNSNGDIEAININDCWIKGKFNLMQLQAETDFTTEEYEASFLIENATFEETIDDGNEWSSKDVEA